MKIVYGDQVAENASVVIEPSRLCHHDRPGRIKQLIELTVPADASNGGYAVRQLLGQDPDIGAKSVVTLEVALTQQQIEKLKNITEDDLSSIRNGVNPAMIFGVRVYDSEPMDVEEFIKKGLSCGAEECRLDGVQEDPASPFVSIPCWGCGEPKPDEQWPKRYLLHRPDPDGCVYLLRNSPDVYWRMKLDDIGKAKKVSEHAWDKENHDVLVRRGYLKEVDVNELWETLADRQRGIERWPKWYRAQGPGSVRTGMSFGNLVCARQDDENTGVTYCERGQWSWKGGFTDAVGMFVGITTEEAMSLVAGCLPVNLDDLDDKSVARTWYQHREPDVVVCRVASNKCVYFEGDDYNPDVMWDYHYDEWLAIGNLVSITEIEALRRIRENREKSLRKRYQAGARYEQAVGRAKRVAVEEPHSWQQLPADPRMKIPVCLRDAFGGGGSPSPGRCDICGDGPCRKTPENIQAAVIGFDSSKDQDITVSVVVTTEPQQSVIELTMQSVLTPGVWVVAFDHQSHIVLEIKQERTLEAPVPASKISVPIGIKLPVSFRSPVMPKDYDRKVFFQDDDFEFDSIRAGLLKGFSQKDKVYMVEVDGERTRYVKHRHIWTIDEPTEGF